MRLTADGETAPRSTIEMAADELLNLSCEWPRVAWSYRMAVPPSDREEWQTIDWTESGKLCKKIVINEPDPALDPVSFYESSSCPRSFGDHSCE